MAETNQESAVEMGVDHVAETDARIPEETPPAKTICGITYLSAFKLFIVIALIVAIVLGLTVWDLDDRIQSLLAWLEENRLKGIAIFISIYAGLTAVFFPSSILTLAGGAVYGFWGIPIVWFAATMGQTLAFLLARYLLHDLVNGWASKYAVWKGINAAITDHALKMTILVRLAAIIPYSATNALLPITNITFFKYTLGSALGILPGVALYVMIGRLAGGIAQISSGNMEEMSNPTLLFTTVGISIVILVVLIVVLTRYAKKAIADQVEQIEESEGTDTQQSATEAEPAESTKRLIE